MLPVKIPVITKEDQKLVNEVLASGYVNDGSWTRKLEQLVSDYHGCYVVACPSATAGMTACINANLKTSSEKIAVVPDITMIATAQAAIAAGCKIWAKNVDDNFMMNQDFNSDAPGCCDIIIPVAYNGKYYDCNYVRKNSYINPLIIVDAAQSILTKGVVNKSADYVVFSLGAIKNITSGIGGLIATKHKDHYEKMVSYRDHGRANRGLAEKTGHEHFSIGHNLKMSDMNAALAYSQFLRADEISNQMLNLQHEYENRIKGNFIQREKGEIPWLIETQLNTKDVPPLRKLYNRIINEPSLQDYIINKEIRPEFNDWYFLPSTHTITSDQVDQVVEELNGKR